MISIMMIIMEIPIPINIRNFFGIKIVLLMANVMRKWPSNHGNDDDDDDDRNNKIKITMMIIMITTEMSIGQCLFDSNRVWLILVPVWDFLIMMITIIIMITTIMIITIPANVVRRYFLLVAALNPAPKDPSSSRSPPCLVVILLSLSIDFFLLPHENERGILLLVSLTVITLLLLLVIVIVSIIVLVLVLVLVVVLVLTSLLVLVEVQVQTFSLKLKNVWTKLLIKIFPTVSVIIKIIMI